MLLLRTRSLLQYVSDLHLERGFKRSIKPRKPFLLLGGDIGYPKQENYKNFLLDISADFDKVFILSGNHEYDKFKDVNIIDNEIENICAARNNLFFLQKKTHTLCDKYNIEIAGCTLWSSFPKSKREYHLDHVNWLTNLVNNNTINKSFVIATHHCPHEYCISEYQNKPKYNPKYFASNQTEIIRNPKVIKWIYGHSHLNSDIVLFNKHLVNNQYGYYKTPLNGYKS